MIYYLEIVGIAAFSVTGVMAAGKKGMDIFSIVLLGVVTAVGGGTLRDVALDSGPVFWTTDLMYLWVSVSASVVTFFLARYFTHIMKPLLFFDAFGLSIFTILATEKALILGFPEEIAVLMGVITGIFGGIIRDILTGRMPLLLGREFYATPALIGGIVFCLLHNYVPEHNYNLIYAVALIFILRASTIQWGLYYPKWLLYSEKKSD